MRSCANRPSSGSAFCGCAWFTDSGAFGADVAAIIDIPALARRCVVGDADHAPRRAGRSGRTGGDVCDNCCNGCTCPSTQCSMGCASKDKADACQNGECTCF
jgi:hypothetical protein